MSVLAFLIEELILAGKPPASQQTQHLVAFASAESSRSWILLYATLLLTSFCIRKIVVRSTPRIFELGSLTFAVTLRKIRNTVVKTHNGENAWRVTAWEDSSLLASNLQRP